MVNQQLVDYIKRSESQGYTLQQLRNYLIQQGYNPKEVDEAMTYANARRAYPHQQPQTSSEKLGFFKKIIMVVKDPTGFYEYIKNEPGIKKALIFYILMILVFIGIQLIVTIAVSFFGGLLTGVLGIIGSLLIMLIVPLALVLIIPLLFLLILLYHGMVKFFKCKNPYNATFRAVIYASIPGMLLSPFSSIPYAGIFFQIIGGIWGIALLTIGIAKLQDLDYTKALIVALLPTILVVVIIVVGVMLGFIKGATTVAGA